MSAVKIPLLQVKFECSSGENLVGAQGQPVLAFNCLARGDEWIPLDLGPSQSRVQSDVTVGHGSLVFYCLWPAGSLQCSTKERVKPSISHSHSPAPGLELHWDCHLAILLQEKISCDMPHSLIVADDVTCNWNGEGT